MKIYTERHYINQVMNAEHAQRILDGTDTPNEDGTPRVTHALYAIPHDLVRELVTHVRTELSYLTSDLDTVEELEPLFTDDFDPDYDTEATFAKLHESHPISDLLKLFIHAEAHASRWTATYTREINAWTKRQAEDIAENGCEGECYYQDVEED